ncbi:MAG TPA: phosphoribosylformylglycinamidine cyclo-ligase, partial [Anaerolineaceae bacterium]|nr:phosphoribosylformylglycinamidine cyclo-ligase [Anaerolineaceae bacterium]
CRFGDPETQAILPLLDSDLLEILLACARGTLDQVNIRWKPGAAACVVLAAPGYPEKPISGAEIVLPNPKDGKARFIFHAGTRLEGSALRAAGGRVLDVTAWDESLPAALRSAYALIDQIQFPGAQYRRDIGKRALLRLNIPLDPPVFQDAYTQSGVDIDAGNRAIQLISKAVRSTYTPAVLAGIGAFGGLFDAAELTAMRHPVLVASTDGIGTKVRLAEQARQLGGLGHDIVNHCINDILVQGARPLFFLDYFAASKLVPEDMAEIVTGMTEACKAAGCVLLGGETAEMPGVYAPGEFDVAGTIVGALERDCILPHPDLQAGDLLVGWRSDSPHTNGYSLIRRVFEGVPLDTVFPELGIPLAEALLTPHRSYLPLLWQLVCQPNGPLKALAHLTGGAFIENIPRVLPEGLQAAIRWGCWPIPPLFLLIQSRAGISDLEMARVFNCGIGMVGVIAPDDLPALQAALAEPTYLIGELRPGARGTVLVS